MWRASGHPWQRNISVLVWSPVLLLGPLLSLGSGGAAALRLAAVVVMAACSITVGLTATRDARDRRALLALAVLVAVTLTVAPRSDSQWLPVWILVGNAVPVVLRGRWLAAAAALVVAASAWAAWLVAPRSSSRVWTEAFVVALALAANTAFTRLTETVDDLRRTRADLARAAVAEERERLSRDLHDLLGHTLSVMVVKAQAVRRLAATDPVGAAAHAADIEEVGRAALLDVRRTVDAMRTPTLPEELAGARAALEAAGVDTTIECTADVPEDTGAVLAWALRESVTNVLRHSNANACTIAVTGLGDRIELTVVDDGVGGSDRSGTARAGGLDGLRERLGAVGGSIEAGPTSEGFRLVASVPARSAVRT